MTRSRRKVPIAGFRADSDRPYKAAEHRRERSAVRVALALEREPPDRRAFGDPWRGCKDGKGYSPEQANILRK